MSLGRLAAALIAAVTLVASCGRDDLDTRRTRSAVVTIEASGCSLVASRGVGIAVGEAGTIVTVAHTIAGATSVVVIDESGVEYDAGVNWFDPRSDIAVLDVPGLSSSGLDLAMAHPGGDAAVLVTRTGEGVVSVGATIGKFISVTIEDIYRDQTVNRSGLELAAEIRRGDSGAAVVDFGGNVVGIVYASSRQRPDVAFAVDDTEIRLAIASAGNGIATTGRCP